MQQNAMQQNGKCKCDSESRVGADSSSPGYLDPRPPLCDHGVLRPAAAEEEADGLPAHEGVEVRHALREARAPVGLQEVGPGDAAPLPQQRRVVVVADAAPTRDLMQASRSWMWLSVNDQAAKAEHFYRTTSRAMQYYHIQCGPSKYRTAFEVTSRRAHVEAHLPVHAPVRDAGEHPALVLAGAASPHEQEPRGLGLEEVIHLHVVVRTLFAQLHPASARPRNLPCGHETSESKVFSSACEDSCRPLPLWPNVTTGHGMFWTNLRNRAKPAKPVAMCPRRAEGVTGVHRAREEGSRATRNQRLTKKVSNRLSKQYS